MDYWTIRRKVSPELKHLTVLELRRLHEDGHTLHGPLIRFEPFDEMPPLPQGFKDAVDLGVERSIENGYAHGLPTAMNIARALKDAGFQAADADLYADKIGDELNRIRTIILAAEGFALSVAVPGGQFENIEVEPLKADILSA